MTQMKLDAKRPMSHSRDPLERPEVGFVPRGRSAGQEDCFQLAQIVARQLRLAAGSASTLQCLFAPGLPSRVPATGGLTTDAQLSRNVGLRTCPAKQGHRFQPPLLLGPVIAASPTQCRIPFHAGYLP